MNLVFISAVFLQMGLGLNHSHPVTSYCDLDKNLAPPGI
jgi:hypothetical protein